VKSKASEYLELGIRVKSYRQSEAGCEKMI